MLISIDEVDKKYTPSDNKKDGNATDNAVGKALSLSAVGLTAGLHEVGGAKGSSVYTQ